MKRIQIIGPRAYPAGFVGTSGVETYLESTVEKLLTSNKDLELVIYTRKIYQQQHPSKTPVRVFVRKVATLPGKVLEAISYSISASVQACFSDGDVVWYHAAGVAIFAWLPALFGKKIWITIHSIDWQRQKWASWESFLFKTAFLFMMKMVGELQLFAVSDAIANEMVKLTSRKCHVAPPGIPEVPNTFKIPQRKNYLLYLGRLVPEKRIEWLAEFAMVHKVPCWIVGSHGNLPAYEKMLRQKYQSNYVKWHGPVVGKAKWKVLAQASCLVLPSELEGFPITILEALATETPCVLAKNMLPAELEKVSLIQTFEVSNREDFNKKLLKQLGKGARGLSFTRRDRSRLGNYSWQRTADVYSLFI